jgi:hypothetical protein
MWWLKAGAVAVFLGLVAWWHLAQVSSAANAARTGERLVWQERQARAEIEADRDRQATQALIKSVEADYWQKQAAGEVQHRDEMAALEQTLTEEKAENDPTPDGKPAPDRCPDFVSKRVRDQLNPIGRDPAPGNNP